jgi:orotate phosphoribosyltransferase
MDIQQALEQTGAVLHGHFHLSSGRHSDTYFEKFRLFEHPEVLGDLSRQLAAPFLDAPPDIVVGPTLGGAILAFEVARALNAEARYLERERDKRALRRGAVIPPDARVLLVDDVLTTGHSVRECLQVLDLSRLVGIATLVVRAPESLEWPVPFHCLLTIDSPSWEPASCPLCAAGQPLQRPGSRSP